MPLLDNAPNATVQAAALPNIPTNDVEAPPVTLALVPALSALQLARNTRLERELGAEAWALLTPTEQAAKREGLRQLVEQADAEDRLLDEMVQRGYTYDELDELFPREEAPVPSQGDPLAGLTHLGPIAVRGAARFRALAAEPVDWVWQDYVVAGTIVTMAGPSSEGKTTLMFLIVLARANTGAPIVLGGRQIKPAPVGKFVVLVEAEHADKSTSRKLVKSADLLGLGDEALDRVIAVSRKAVTLGSPEWKDIERMIAAGLVSDVVLDTIARVAPGDGNSEEKQAAHFAAIAAAIEKAPSDYQPTVWALAHTRKGNADALDDVSGSTQRVGQADTVLMVTAERSDSGQVTSSTMRLLKPREEPEAFPDPLVVRVHDGRLEITSEAPSKGKKSKDSKPGANVDQIAKVRAAILAQVEEAGPFLILGHLKKRAAELGSGIKGSAWVPAMEALAAEGFLHAREPKDGKPNGWDYAGV